jgi:predicted benzoate:H+ symporter BenE
LMLGLGLSGWVGRAMSAMPIVIAMVAGVLLRFGVDLVRAFWEQVWIALPMTLAFVLLTAAPRISRALPPLVGSLPFLRGSCWRCRPLLSPRSLASSCCACYKPGSWHRSAITRHSTLGAMVCFLVTVADVPVLGIGAACWGLQLGLLTARVLEHPARTASRPAARAAASSATETGAPAAPPAPTK